MSRVAAIANYVCIVVFLVNAGIAAWVGNGTAVAAWLVGTLGWIAAEIRRRDVALTREGAWVQTEVDPWAGRIFKVGPGVTIRPTIRRDITTEGGVTIRREDGDA